jgi:glutathione S-transferase
MCEDHLYWAILHDRWMLDENFDKGPRTFFDFAPWALRPLIVAMVRREVKRNLWGHGLGRHTQAEIALLAARDLEAIAGFLGDKPWLMGEKPCGADATVWSFVAGALCPLFQGAIYANAQSHSNLVTYAERGTERWFPALAACR